MNNLLSLKGKLITNVNFMRQPTMMNRKICMWTLCTLFSFTIHVAQASSQGKEQEKIEASVHPETGGITALSISGDERKMNWLLETDGTQYDWVKPEYQWGLGRAVVNGSEYKWSEPEQQDKNSVTYRLGTSVTLQVKRRMEQNDFVEQYIFRNTGNNEARLNRIAIYTPWNDNYPDAATCMTSRCHAHIWAGGSTAYVKAIRMNGEGTHIGLAVTQGSIEDYEVFERDAKKGLSNFRGVLAMNLPDLTLKPNESYEMEWRLFTHHDTDFETCLIKRGSIVASSPRYVYEIGDTAKVRFCSATDTTSVQQKVTRPGSLRVVYRNSQGKEAYADLLGVSSIESLLAHRAKFILEHQQMNEPTDERSGAYMVYDNEGDSILTHSNGRSDCDEGRERVGMGIFLAMYYQKHPDKELLASLRRYADFIYTKLQNDSYQTWSTTDHKSKNRGYNYAWIADFYFRMYDITGEQRYAQHGYGTMRALFRQFGHDFYCIDYPLTSSLRTLKNAGMKAERDTLLADYRQTGEVFLKNGLHFPKSEVNYEQSIIAPAVQYLCELYLCTKDQRYLKGAQEMLPALEAFGGFQPSYHLNEIAIRHWDGYWFGKRRVWGDVFPHYWSTVTAGAYYYYAKATGNTRYLHRAENIVRNNFCLFTEEGRATCAFIYPGRVNGEPAHFADAYANDQDFALAYYLLIQE